MATRIKGAERREAPRLNTRVPLRISRESGGTLLTRTHNISVSGAYCTVNRFMPPMVKLQVKLELPTRPRTLMTCAGVVVRVEPPQAKPNRSTYRVAIFFNDLSVRDRLILMRFVQQQLRAPSSTRSRSR